jgi:hypothetical protein
MATSWPLGRAYLEENILGRVGHMRHSSVNFGFRNRIDGKSSQESEGGGTAQHHSKNAAFPISHFHWRIVRLSPRGQRSAQNQSQTSIASSQAQSKKLNISSCTTSACCVSWWAFTFVTRTNICPFRTDLTKFNTEIADTSTSASDTVREAIVGLIGLVSCLQVVYQKVQRALESVIGAGLGANV